MRPARIALYAAMLCAVAGIALLVTSGSDGYRLRVQTSDAAGLRKNFLVKIAGAPVGKVVDVQLDKADHAVAVLQLDKGAGPVGRNARAAIRASNLLGEKYVDLVPGDVAGRPAPSGFVIPPSRTTTPSDLDDVLSVLDPDTRVALGAFLVGQGEALTGRGGDLAKAIVALPPTLDAAQQLVTGLAQHNGALGSLVQRSDRVLSALAPRRAALGRLVTSASGALDALDARGTRLGQTLDRAPGAIHQLRTSLASLQKAAEPLAPAARGLQATAAPLTQTLQALPGFAAAARPTLRTARSVAPQLQRLGQQAEPVVHRLAPAASGLRSFASALQPTSKLLDQGIADTLGVMQGWARAIQNRDNVGHVFRVSVELGGDVLNQLSGYINKPATPSRHRHDAASSQRPLLPAPKVTLPKVTLPKVTLPKITLPGASTAAAAVHQLLDYLLKP